MDCAQVTKALGNSEQTTSYMRLVVSTKPKRFSLTEDSSNYNNNNQSEQRKLWDEKITNLQNAYAMSSCRATAL